MLLKISIICNEPPKYEPPLISGWMAAFLFWGYQLCFTIQSVSPRSSTIISRAKTTAACWNCGFATTRPMRRSGKQSVFPRSGAKKLFGNTSVRFSLFYSRILIFLHTKAYRSLARERRAFFIHFLQKGRDDMKDIVLILDDDLFFREDDEEGEEPHV